MPSTDTPKQEGKEATSSDGQTTYSRREFMQNVAVAGAAASATTILGAPAIVRAQTDKGPIKFGLIEDYSGIAAYQGLPKNHAVQLAIKEINAGYMLKGGPTGPGGLGAFGQAGGFSSDHEHQRQGCR